jgi:hypothetical protein
VSALLRQIFLTNFSICIFVCGLATPVSATPVTWEFDLVFDSTDGGNLADEVFTGSFSFDRSVVDGNPNAVLSANNSFDGPDADFLGDGFITGFELNIADDAFTLDNASNAVLPAVFFTGGAPSFLVYAGTIASNSASLKLNEFFFPATSVLIGGACTSVECIADTTNFREAASSVPSPPTWMLIATALVLLGVRRIKRDLANIF